jgi:hypothetical protein
LTATRRHSSASAPRPRARCREPTAGVHPARPPRTAARTPTDPGARHADINATLAFAHRRAATPFELRAALDDYELRGQPVRAPLIDATRRIPTNNAWPELARATGQPF